jgi:hypothetical protein
MTDQGQFSLQAARKFADKYKDATSEKQLGQSYWRDLLSNVVGVPDLLVAGIEFEFPVRSASGTINFIDVLWSGVALIEHKSAGKNLDEAEQQARAYLIALPAELRPPTIIVSDFQKIRIVEVLAGTSHEFKLVELPENLERLEMVVGRHAEAAAKVEVSADQKAVELMANLYVEFEKAGYEGHEVSVFLVRILFLNFGDDTRMWKRTPKGLFGDFVSATVPDGMGVGGRLQELFQILDTPIEKRPGTISPTLADFPYVNGGLFTEVLPVFSFTAKMREALLLTTEYDWSKISPAIFGAMFQTVKSKEDRRNLGEHYTSEANILKVIRPLFLDEFTDKLHKAWESIPALKKLHVEMSQHNFLDPACGSGNFLVVAYKRLRDLELKLVARLQELEGTQGQVFIDGRMGLAITLNQFHGIEINEWSSQIATVAMYLADHQANLAMEEITGASPNRFPLDKSARIVHANSLRIDWSEACPMNEQTIIMGNPPFLGQTYQDAEQKEDTRNIWKNHAKTGVMDFVSNWHLIAARQMSKTAGRTAFVSTNSLAQGEQVPPLWGELWQNGMELDFAHRTFAWSNEAKGKAAVHCVILGFSPTSHSKKTKKRIWFYDNAKGVPNLVEVSQINPYLVEGPQVVIDSRSKPISSELAPMIYGSKPTDDGYLSKISGDEVEEIKAKDPVAYKYIRKIIGAQELINGGDRYCLWLDDANPSDLNSSPELKRRIAAVREFRLASPAALTRTNASISHLFVQRAQPKSSYIAVPSVSSETRRYVPMDYCEPEVIANNLLLMVPNAGLAVFSALMSKPFNVWNGAVSGRLESRFRISQEITYNNFPLRSLSTEERTQLEATGQAILDERAKFPEATLADLYGPNSMPLGLIKAHEANDRLMLKVFGLKTDATDEQILARLFAEYEEMTRGLLEPAKVKRTRK